jgi:hypothetical protein
MVDSRVWLFETEMVAVFVSEMQATATADAYAATYVLYQGGTTPPVRPSLYKGLLS